MIFEYTTVVLTGALKERTEHAEVIDQRKYREKWTRLGMDVTDEQTALWYRRVSLKNPEDDNS